MQRQTRETLTIRFDKRLLQQIEAQAEVHAVSRTAVISMACAAYLSQVQSESTQTQEIASA